MANHPAVLCLDVGGSSVKSGVVLGDGRVVVGPYRQRSASRGPTYEIVGGLATALLKLHAGAEDLDVSGIGVAMPGPFDYQLGVSHMRGIGKFEAIHGVPLAVAVTSHAHQLAALPWRWINDAQAFALGELRFGAAVGVARAMFLTIGTGCGSAFALDGVVITEGHGVPRDGYVYSLVHDGKTVDELLSARGLVRLWREAAPDKAGRGRSEVSGTAKSGSRRPSARRVGRLAEDGDVAAVAAFRRFGEVLATALAPVFREFRPELVVMGGQVSRSLRHFGPAAEAAGAPPLVVSAAPDSAALRGAAVHFLESTG